MNFNLFRYAAVFLGVSLLVLLVTYLVFRFFQIDMSNFGVAFFPFMFAAMGEGQYFARRNQSRPSQSVLWKSAIVMTLIGLLISTALALLFYGLDDETARSLASFSIQFWAIVFIAVFLIGVVISRIFFGMGARNELKIQKRKAG